MNIFSLWSSYSNVTINYHHYTTGKISIFLCLTSEQFNNLISPCNQNQQYLLQPLQWLHEEAIEEVEVCGLSQEISKAGGAVWESAENSGIKAE